MKTISTLHIRKRAGERGQGLVEFALVLPILLLLVLGIMDFGYFLFQMNAVSGAAREGVRVAAVTAPDAAAVTAAVTNLLTAANMQNPVVTIAGPNAASEVSVTVQATYNSITGGLVPGIGTTVVLTRTSIMRWEN
jgi:Flp pilus assembly protein TadG